MIIQSLILAASLLAPEAHATSMVELTPDQLVDASDLIVRAHVDELWTERHEDGRVWTRVQLDVTQVLKGDEATEDVVIDLLGGAWAGRALLVHGSARFDVGEDVLVYLEELESGRITVVGKHQGKLTVKMDPQLREPIAFSTPLRAQRAYDHRFYPLPAEDLRVTVDALVDDIAARVEAGWDGQPIPGSNLGVK